jgi:hypothetical protein
MMKHKILLVTWIFLLLSVLAACTTVPATPTETAVTPLPATATETAAMPVPSDTPTVTARLLLVSAGAPEEAATAAAIASLADQAGLTVTPLTALTAADLDAGVRIVVWLRPDETIQALAASAPEVAFVGITSRALEPAANLSVIRLRSDYQTFIGGMITTLIAPDWRGGGLLPTDGPLGDAASNALINGGRYYCGRCAPYYAPVVLFPVISTLPSTSDPAAWQAAAAALHEQNRLEVIYLAPEAVSFELATALATQFVLVGGAAPANGVPANWAATVTWDVPAALQSIWEDLVANTMGQASDAPLILSDVNPELLSPGRQALLQEAMDLLAAGQLGALTP